MARKIRTVWIVENSATGEWVFVAESLEVAQAHQKARRVESWTKITETTIVTQDKIGLL